MFVYIQPAHLMGVQKFEWKKNFFPMKYRPKIGREIAVCDLVIAVCDLVILYRMPQEPQTFFFAPYHSYGSD